MKLPGEEEVGGGMGSSMIYMVIGVSAFILIVLFIVFRGNADKRSGTQYQQEVRKQQEETVIEEQTASEETAAPKRRAEDLELWDM